MTKPILYVTQDGPYFYIYRTPECDKLHNTWTYRQGRVTNWDLPAAERARAAFVAQAEYSGYLVEFPNPFGES